MPAAARKPSPESYQDNHATTVRGARSSARGGVATKGTPVKGNPVKGAPAKGGVVRKRWHESPPTAKSTPTRRKESAEDWRGLIDHFGSEETAHVEIEEKDVDARRVARRKARLKHRPFRMTLLASAFAGSPLLLLACLLWMKSSALELARQDKALQDKIEAARFELQSTRREIAAVNASPQVEQWAKERGWRQATQQDFDDVSKAATPMSNAAISSESTEGNDAP